MLSCKRWLKLGYGAFRQISVEANHAVISSSGEQLHPLWLRERCLSPASVQQETRQPLLQPFDLPADLKITSAQLQQAPGASGKQFLTVTFTDGHISVFDAAELDAEVDDFASYGIQQRDIKWPRIKTWDKETGSSIQRLSYADVMSGSTEILLKLTWHLLAEGHAIVEGVPSRDMEVAAFARVVSGFPGGQVVRPTNWGPVFNVRSYPDAALKDLAYTAEALPPHVDNPYRNPNPGFQLLHVLENECKSGESLAVDGFHVAEQLRAQSPEWFEILTATDLRWENDGGDRSTALVHWAPMIEVNQSSGVLSQVRYSPKSGGYCPAMTMEKAEQFFLARRRFSELLNAESNTVRFQMFKGDLWIFNNLRVLHGRGSFNPNEGFRFLQGAYIDIDAVTSTYFRSKYKSDHLRIDCNSA